MTDSEKWKWNRDVRVESGRKWTDHVCGDYRVGRGFTSADDTMPWDLHCSGMYVYCFKTCDAAQRYAIEHDEEIRALIAQRRRIAR